jgi:hypothetical protein
VLFGTIFCAALLLSQVTFGMWCILRILVVGVRMNGCHYAHIQCHKNRPSTFAIGANSGMCKNAQLITVSEPSNISGFTLNTIVFKSPVAGAEIYNAFCAGL